MEEGDFLDEFQSGIGLSFRYIHLGVFMYCETTQDEDQKNT